MDAYTVFKTILLQVESSQLNYSITKTPFSASISLKASFVKIFQSSGQNQEEGINQEPQMTVITAPVKSEPADEKQNINDKLKIALDQKNNLEGLLQSEKAKVGALTSELKLKEEIKGEKYSSNSQFKTLIQEISGMSTNIKNLEEKLEVKVKDDAQQQKLMQKKD